MAEEPDRNSDDAAVQKRAEAERYACMAAYDCIVQGLNHLLAEVTTWFNAKKHIADPFYRDVFAAMVELSGANHPAVPFVVAEKLRKCNAPYGETLEKIGQLMQDSVSQGGHLRYYCRRVYDHYRARVGSSEALAAADELLRTDDVDVPLERLAELPNRLRPAQQTIGRDIDRAFDTAIDRLENNTQRPGIRCGVEVLDRHLDGMTPGSLVVVGAATGAGKSTLMNQIAAQVATTDDAGAALVVSLEMKIEELLLRWASYFAGVKRHERRDLVAGLSKVEELTKQDKTLHVFTSLHKVTDIEAMVRAYCQQMHVGVVVVDYLQLVVTDKGITSREQQVADVTRRLKLLANETDTVIVTGSQLNRAGQAEPTLTSLRESGSIEQDADIVLLLIAGTDDSDSVPLRIRIAKNRSGPGGLVIATWDKPIFRIRDQDVYDMPNHDVQLTFD